MRRILLPVLVTLAAPTSLVFSAPATAADTTVTKTVPLTCTWPDQSADNLTPDPIDLTVDVTATTPSEVAPAGRLDAKLRTTLHLPAGSQASIGGPGKYGSALLTRNALAIGADTVDLSSSPSGPYVSFSTDPVDVVRPEDQDFTLSRETAEVAVDGAVPVRYLGFTIVVYRRWPEYTSPTRSYVLECAPTGDATIATVPVRDPLLVSRVVPVSHTFATTCTWDDAVGTGAPVLNVPVVVSGNLSFFDGADPPMVTAEVGTTIDLPTSVGGTNPKSVTVIEQRFAAGNFEFNPAVTERNDPTELVFKLGSPAAVPSRGLYWGMSAPLSSMTSGPTIPVRYGGFKAWITRYVPSATDPRDDGEPPVSGQFVDSHQRISGHFLDCEVVGSDLVANVPVSDQSPVVDSITGRAWGSFGGLLLVRGSHLDRATSVTIGGRRALAVPVGGQLYVWAPALRAGTYPLVVHSPAGSSVPASVTYRRLW